MVKRWFADDLLGVTKRGAILNRPNSKFSYYWPGDVSPNGERIVRVPYSLNFGFLSRLFGEIKVVTDLYIDVFLRRSGQLLSLHQVKKDAWCYNA